ncbi:MAG: hypothetical protein VW835_10225, partial [Rickettsiales bacterium]
MTNEAEETTGQDAVDAAPEKPEYSKTSPRGRRRMRNLIRLGLMILGPAAVLIAGAYYYVV